MMDAKTVDQQPTNEHVASEFEENPRLCWKCKALFNSRYTEQAAITTTSNPQGEPESVQTRKVRTLDKTESTAVRGCPLCLQMLYSLNVAMRSTLSKWQEERELSVESSRPVYEQSLTVKKGNAPILSLHIIPDNAALVSRPDEIKCAMQLYPASEFESYVNTWPIEGNTNSRASWALVARWLEQCTRNHKLCNLSPEVIPALPCRVIDIGLGDQTTPRLIIVNEQTPLAPYATMSHCWGSNMPLRLTSKTIAALQEGISISLLSKSFQDGIVTARRLGVRYLWIDSLCIIQDSEKDWREQSASMAQIYSNSYCNIAAAHASNGTYGCFINREPDLIKPLKIDLKWGPRQGIHYAVQWHYWSQNVLETPLNRRAWVCQERFLARRNLFFGETQLYWECGEMAASEQFPFGLPPTSMKSSPKGITPHIDGARIRKELCMKADPTLDAFSVWSRIVGRYTTGQLTYQTDKLIALSGLAVKMHRHIQSQYLAGMWRKNLAYQLLWKARGIQWVISRSRIETYVAPSWSWASVNGHIENACDVWYADDREILIKILDAKVEVVSNDSPFGQVKSGFLRIKGSLAQAGVHIEESKSNRGSYQLFIHKQCAGNAYLDIDSGGTEPSTYRDLYYLPIRYKLGHADVIENGAHVLTSDIYGIILRPIVGRVQQSFIRVGIFDILRCKKEFKSACSNYHEGNNEIGSMGWGRTEEIVIF